MTDAFKEELALALLLWKDFKSEGKFDIEVTRNALYMARELKCLPQFEKLIHQLPPMRIVPR